MHILKKYYTSPLYMLCMLVPQIISLLTLTLIHTLYEESIPRFSTFRCLSSRSQNLTICHDGDILKLYEGGGHWK